MGRQAQTFQLPMSMALAIGATTPNPGAPGARVWSTTVDAVLVWDGAMWALPDAGVPRELPYGAANPSTVDKIHAGDFGTRGMLEFDASDAVATNLPYALQPARFSTKARTWLAQANSNTPLNDGFPTVTYVAGAGSTLTARTIAASSVFAGSTRVGLVTATTTGSIAAWRANALINYHGADLNAGGGYFFAVRVGWPAVTAGMRAFIGMSATAAIGNVEPNSVVNSFGLQCNAADANWFVGACGAAASADRVDTGLAKNVVNTWYDIILSVSPGAGKLGWAVRRGHYGATWLKGVISTGKMPATNTLLSAQVMSTNGTTAAALQMDLSHVYLETDY